MPQEKQDKPTVESDKFDAAYYKVLGGIAAIAIVCILAVIVVEALCYLDTGHLAIPHQADFGDDTASAYDQAATIAGLSTACSFATIILIVVVSIPIRPK